MADSSERITWRPGISDPTVLAWVITCVFLAAGVACIVRLRRAPQPKRLSAFWLVGAGLFTFLAFNKQLDLQVLLIQLGRAWTTNLHWFEHRRGVQTLFVVLLGAGATGTVLVFAWMLRPYWSSTRLALIGVGCTLIVISLRAAVICHVCDRLIHAVGTTPSTVHHRLEPLELIGPLCVVAYAWLSRGAGRDGPRSR